MKRLTAKFHIALGQTGLLASLLLVAIYLGLVPDRVGAIREGRAALAEAIAANSSAFISQADIRRLEANLRLVVDRNDDILSAAVRRGGCRHWGSRPPLAGHAQWVLNRLATASADLDHDAEMGTG
jgi:hypothetical protein